MRIKGNYHQVDLPPIGEMSEILYLYSGDKCIATCAVRSDGKLVFSGNESFEVKKMTIAGEYQTIERREI